MRPFGNGMARQQGLTHQARIDSNREQGVGVERDYHAQARVADMQEEMRE